MSFDIEPDSDPHGECSLEIKRLNEALERLHGQAEAALNRFKGWIPWDIVHDSQAKTENAFIEDARKRIDQILADSKGSDVKE